MGPFVFAGWTYTTDKWERLSKGELDEYMEKELEQMVMKRFRIR
jgi:hypothetical protein